MPAENLQKLVSPPVFAFKALQKLRIAFIKLLFTSKLALGQVDEYWLAGFILSQGFTGGIGEDDHDTV